MAGYNPIAFVGTEIDGSGEIINGISLPAPSSYQYEWEDISKDGARTEDITMQKNRVGRVFALSLSWEKVKISDCAKIMQAFKPEYIFVKYLDAEKGVFLTREFYTGNGTAPLFSTKTGKWESLSFKLTARRNAL